MHEDPAISVIIPVYNGERYLAECVESVFHQTYSNLEVLVVDDASTDSTNAIVDRLRKSDMRLRHFRNKQNLGSGGSRNVGIRNARANVVAFLDADDRWYQNLVETQLQIMEANPDVGCLFCDFDFIDRFSKITDGSSGQYWSPDVVPTLTRISIESLWQGQGPMPMPSTAIFRRSALLDVGLFPEGYCEDINLWIRFAARHTFAATGLILASYRKHHEQKTSDGYRFLLGRADAYLDAVGKCPEIRQLVGPRLFAQVMYRHTLAAGDYWFWKKQDYQRASEYLWRAYRYKPSELGTLAKLAWCWTPETMRRLMRTVKNGLS